jgi:hypothetical protein
MEPKGLRIRPKTFANGPNVLYGLSGNCAPLKQFVPSALLEFNWLSAVEQPQSRVNGTSISGTQSVRESINTKRRP